MKKFFLTVITLTLTLSSPACTNPSMEEGLAKLDKSLAELGRAIESLNIPQMQSDLEQMNLDAAQMLEDIQNQEDSWSSIITQLQEINQMLDEMVEQSETWATSSQMQDLLTDIQEFGEGVDTLVLTADYDYDGVINAIDQCPDTPLKDINNVNEHGCAPDETPITNKN